MSTYYIRKNQQVSGPFPQEEIERMVRLNRLKSIDEICQDGGAWTRLHQSAFWRTVNLQSDWTPPKTPAVDTEPRITVNPRIGVRAATVSSRKIPEDKLTPRPSAKYERDTMQSQAKPNVKQREWQLPTYAEERQQKQRSSLKSGAAKISFLKLLLGGFFTFHSAAALHEVINGAQQITQTPFGMVRTWIWSKVLGVFLVLSIILYSMIDNPIIIPGFIFISSLTVPIAVLTFFLECDISRQISAWRVTFVFLVGGILSLLVTTVFNYLPGVDELTREIASAVAGILEEPAKAIILLPFLANAKRYPYVLNGLLLGAAVGTGFAVFETAGYVYVNPEIGLGVLILRSVLAPFMHIAWTAAVGGALWMARGSGALRFSVFLSPFFLGIFLLVIGLHMTWNDLAEAGRSSPYIGGVGWIAIIFLIKRGFAQVAEEQKALRKE